MFCAWEKIAELLVAHILQTGALPFTSSMSVIGRRRLQDVESRHNVANMSFLSDRCSHVSCVGESSMRWTFQSQT